MNRKNKLTITVLLAVLATVLLAAGCGPTPTPTPPGESLEWEKIADSNGVGEEFVDPHYANLSFAYVGHEPRLIVIRDLAAVSTLRGRVLSSHLERIADTDFSSFWVAVIHRGTEMTTDYHPIEVGAVRLQDNTITIYAQLHKETFDERFVFSPSISAYYVLRIKKPAGIDEEEMSFALNADGQVVPQICAIKGDHLPWEKIAYDDRGGRDYEGRPPRLAIIADQGAVSSVQDLYSEYLELIANVDFSTHFVALVYHGDRVETGYSVEVIDVKRQEDTIFVCVQLHDPHPREKRGQMVTLPYEIMKIKKTPELEDDFNFILIVNGAEVMRQQHSIP